jgi:hypothetical protein
LGVIGRDSTIHRGKRCCLHQSQVNCPLPAHFRRIESIQKSFARQSNLVAVRCSVAGSRNRKVVVRCVADRCNIGVVDTQQLRKSSACNFRWVRVEARFVVGGSTQPDDRHVVERFVGEIRVVELRTAREDNSKEQLDAVPRMKEIPDEQESDERQRFVLNEVHVPDEQEKANEWLLFWVVLWEEREKGKSSLERIPCQNADWMRKEEEPGTPFSLPPKEASDAVT